MLPVMFSMEASDKSLVDELVVAEDIKAKTVVRERITGGSELVTVLIALTPVVAVAIVRILKEKWARNGKVSVEARGVRITGASPEDIERILKQILEGTAEGND